jgi:hypothetical protein
MRLLVHFAITSPVVIPDLVRELNQFVNKPLRLSHLGLRTRCSQRMVSYG